jgi:hypothetical protein
MLEGTGTKIKIIKMPNIVKKVVAFIKMVLAAFDTPCSSYKGFGYSNAYSKQNSEIKPMIRRSASRKSVNRRVKSYWGRYRKLPTRTR